MSHYQHLTIKERESLLRGIASGKTNRGIAKELNRFPSTISQEVKRNCRKIESYSAVKAERNYKTAKKEVRQTAKAEEFTDQASGAAFAS